MKNFFNLLSLVVILFASSSLFPQEASLNREDSGRRRPYIVQYDAKSLSDHRPNFKNAIVCLGFDGDLASDVVSELRKRDHERRFVVSGEGDSYEEQCRVDGTPFVLITFAPPRFEQFAGSASYNNNSGSGKFQSQGPIFSSKSSSGSLSQTASQNGVIVTAPAYIYLYRRDHSVVLLGKATSQIFAGDSQGTFSSSTSSNRSSNTPGRSVASFGFGGGSSSGNSRKSPGTAVAQARKRAILRLIDPSFWKGRNKFWDIVNTDTQSGTKAEWVPGANAEIQQTFGK